MAITITDKFSEYNSEFDYSAPVTAKNMKINLEGSSTQRLNTEKNKEKPNSMKKLSKQE